MSMTRLSLSLDVDFRSDAIDVSNTNAYDGLFLHDHWFEYCKFMLF
jgi:hypothetical protein